MTASIPASCPTCGSDNRAVAKIGAATMYPARETCTDPWHDAGGNAQVSTELETLLKMPDSEIDTSDIPEVTDWSKAERGKFHQQVSTGEEPRRVECHDTRAALGNPRLCQEGQSSSAEMPTSPTQSDKQQIVADAMKDPGLRLIIEWANEERQIKAENVIVDRLTNPMNSYPDTFRCALRTILADIRALRTPREEN